jgi:hypothetical protein
LLNSVQVTGAGREVDLTFTVPAEMLDLIDPSRRPSPESR